MRIVVADDHPLYREGLVAVIATLADAVVIGEAADGAEAVRIVGELRPDIVVMDVNMPGMGGVEATRQIVQMNPEVAVLVLTMLEGDDTVVAALRAGARGYLLKGAARADLARALEAVQRGEIVFSPTVGERVLAHFGSGPTPMPTRFPALTAREHEILDLVAQGLTNPAIARRLFLSEKTVRNHVSNVFAKMNVASRAEAVAHARDAGLGHQT